MDREQLLKVANARLCPSLTNPNYLVLRSRRNIFESHVRKLANGLQVLDVGGRYQPYRPLLGEKISRYLAIDIEHTDLVDVLASGEQIPFRDETFDFVIATQVFEYFEAPGQAATEIHRVLKSGGSVFVSVASVLPSFVPAERWRFLPAGVRSLFSRFSNVTITPEVSSLGGLCRLLNIALHDSVKVRVFKVAYASSFCPVLNLMGLALENFRLTSNDRWTGNYSVVAVK